MNPAFAIEIRGLTKHYKNGVLANDTIDLDVPAGTIFGLLGPNGAGKTTLVRQLTGELLPTSGSVTVAGIDVVRHPKEAKWLMGVVPQEAGTFDVITAEDHLKIFARLRGLGVAAASVRAEEMLTQLDLLPHRSKQSWHLSGGIRRKLLVGIALVARPQVLILDEPTTGLDPRSRRDVWDLISTVRRGGATVLLTTHYMEEAESLCNQVAIIGEGRILARGSIDEIRARCRYQYKAGYQQNGDLLTVYGRTQPEVVARLESLGVVEYALSKTSLEDLYLELTGHEMEAPPDA